MYFKIHGRFELKSIEEVTIISNVLDHFCISDDAFSIRSDSDQFHPHCTANVHL